MTGDAAAAALTDTLSFAGDGPTVLAGGILGALRRRVEERIGATEYADHPVVGAVALAADECGATINREALARALRES